jgi:hypothetical protein
LIRYAQYENVGKPKNLKMFGSNKSKDLNRVATIGKCQLCPREENLRFDNIYII